MVYVPGALKVRSISSAIVWLASRFATTPKSVGEPPGRIVTVLANCLLGPLPVLLIVTVYRWVIPVSPPGIVRLLGPLIETTTKSALPGVLVAVGACGVLVLLGVKDGGGVEADPPRGVGDGGGLVTGTFVHRLP